MPKEKVRSYKSMVIRSSKRKSFPLKWVSQSPAQTQAWGAKLAKQLQPPRVIALVGELGAGKTCLVKGLAKGFQVKSKDLVLSPTFTIINEYQGKYSIYHMDLYRLNSEEEFCDLGYEDYFYGHGITLVEWADQIESLLPKDTVKIKMKVIGENQRKIECSF